MNAIRFLSAGESHGPKITGILEGIPSGFFIDKKKINQDLKRRQQGFGRGGRMKIECDKATLCAGVVDNKTTGAPIAIEIVNADYKNWKEKNIPPMNSPRPGHVDYAGAIKYNHEDLRLSLERASARETAIRTAIGSICKQLLDAFGISILSYVTQIGTIASSAESTSNAEKYIRRFKASLLNEFAFVDDSKTSEIKELITKTMKEKDTLGGTFECVALSLPPGLGSYVHYDRKLDAKIAQAMMSIPAMKAVEIGEGVINASKKGTEVHDEFVLSGEKVERLTNKAGGLEGGVTNGMPLVVKTYMKPISTTLTPRKSINLKTKQESKTTYERSDFCAVTRARVVGESMLSFVILDALLQKIGSDNKKDMLLAFSQMNKGRLDELNMKDEDWRFNYE